MFLLFHQIMLLDSLTAKDLFLSVLTGRKQPEAALKSDLNLRLN